MSFYGPQFPDYLLELMRDLAAPLVSEAGLRVGGPPASASVSNRP
jgi:hypothetical protein